MHGGTRHFIKMEVWHTLFLPLLRKALPEVNWIYLHRDPMEVLVSLREMPSHHIIPGAIPSGYLGKAELPEMALEEFAAFMLSRSAGAAADHWSLGGGMMLYYPAIRSSLPGSVAGHFGLRLDAAECAAMELAAKRDAKSPGQPFTDDTPRKRAAAGPEIRAISDHWLSPVCARLEALHD
jgi:hypothetical protein